MEVDYTKRISSAENSLFESGSFNIYDTTVLNLTAGAPGPDLLKSCCEIMDVATKHRMNMEQSENATLFQYGPVLGRHDFRVELSKFLEKYYQEPVHCDDLMLTTGATHGLHLVLSTLIDLSEGVIFVDEVTYMIALQVMAQFPALRVIPVVLNNDGVDVADLERKVIEHKFQSKTKLFWGIYYTMTVFHNPTGIVFSNDICKQLIELSRKHDFLVLSEDVYNMLSYKDSYLPQRLFSYDNMNDSDYKGNIISNGTFSKIIAPGLRMGWMECPPRCIDVFRRSGVLQSGGATNNYGSGVMVSLLQLGLAEKQVNTNLKNYKERMLLACKLLKQHLPKTCSFNEPLGGYFIWIQFPVGTDLAKFNEYAKEKHNVYAITGDRFSTKQLFKNYLRISIAFHTVDNLEKGIKKLCFAYEEFNKK